MPLSGTLQVPGFALSVPGICGLPVMLGGRRFVNGRPVTRLVSWLASAGAVPPGDAAVTLTAIGWPTSAAPSRYVDPEPTWAQASVTLVASAGQRSHV